MREMIALRGEQSNFNFRVAAVVLDPAGERVLIHRAVGDPFWIMPGGRVELTEAAADALKREMQEELGVSLEIERLLWIVENFFRYEGRRHHELAFYFLAAFPSDSPLYTRRQPFRGDEDGMELIFEWHDLEDIGQVNLVPSFLRAGLKALPESVKHIVHFDT